MSDLKSIQTDQAPAPVGPYSQAIAHCGLLFLSGQIPLDPQTGELVPGEIEAQTQQVLDNMRAVLAAADLTPDDVVKTTIFLTDLALFPRVNEVYGKFFTSEPQPARSTVEVSKLPLGVSV
ncbi:MAG: RidA family protein, partial [Deltaproteobacteria bacterium]|nr:RidA family protein [Deltaproteobacteria bacterium]